MLDELYSYDINGNTSIYHTRYRHGVIDDVFTATTRSYGYDANSTFYVSCSMSCMAVLKEDMIQIESLLSSNGEQ